MEDETIKTIIDVAEAAQNVRNSIKTTDDGREFVILRRDGSDHVQWLTSAPEAPRHIAAQETFADAESFARYVARFNSDPDAEYGPILLTAHVGKSIVKAVFDYPLVGQPTRACHSAIWQMSPSIEYRAWSAFCGNAQREQLHPQETFMRFLEENSAEIVSPAPNKIMELVSDFESITTVTFKSARRLDNGLRELVYNEQGSGVARSAQLPARVELRMPIFHGEAAYDVTALLRHRITNGELHLGLTLHRVDRVVQAAFAAAAERVSTLCELPLHVCP